MQRQRVEPLRERQRVGRAIDIHNGRLVQWYELPKIGTPHVEHRRC